MPTLRYMMRKAAGGRTYRLFLPVLRAKASARRELNTELRRAFSEKEFVLYYQPQLRISDGSLVVQKPCWRWNIQREVSSGLERSSKLLPKALSLST